MSTETGNKSFSYLPTFLFPMSLFGRRKLAKEFGKCSSQRGPSSHKMHSRAQRSREMRANKIITGKMSFASGAFFGKILGCKSV